MVKKKTKRKLVSAAPGCSFWTCNGLILGNLKELRDALKKMDEKTFAYHVNKEKNDFARWIEDILQDADLSKKLRKLKTKKTSLKAISDHLKKIYSIK